MYSGMKCLNVRQGDESLYTYLQRLFTGDRRIGSWYFWDIHTDMENPSGGDQRPPLYVGHEGAGLVRLTLSLFLLSFGLLVYELTLTRMFAVVMFSDLAHLALALAMLGTGIGALFQHLYQPIRR